MALSRDSEKDTDKKPIGDDVIGASHPCGPLSIWTTGVWERESMVMRWIEHGLIKLVQRWSAPPRCEPIDFLKSSESRNPQKGIMY